MNIEEFTLSLFREFLLNKGYIIKHGKVGWWVDGVCGFLVSDGYYDTEEEAITEAIKMHLIGCIYCFK